MEVQSSVAGNIDLELEQLELIGESEAIEREITYTGPILTILCCSP